MDIDEHARARSDVWDQMFDLQYALTVEIDKLIRDACKRYPPIWRPVVMMYLVEHFAEASRQYIDLPSFVPVAEDPDA